MDLQITLKKELLRATVCSSMSKHLERTRVFPQTQLIFCLLACYIKRTVFCKYCISKVVFQVHAKSVTVTYSQAVNLVQPKPKFSVQIAKAPFVGVPVAVEIYWAVSSFLKDRPTSASSFLITVHFKMISQTFGIDFVHSTDLHARFVSFSAALIDWKKK